LHISEAQIPWSGEALQLLHTPSPPHAISSVRPRDDAGLRPSTTAGGDRVGDSANACKIARFPVFRWDSGYCVGRARGGQTRMALERGETGV
jgi:hypothetical protein